MKSTLAAVAALTMAVAAPPALAAAPSPDLVVEYGDLDLATAEGQEALEDRIDAAARKYCGVGSQRTGTRMRPSTAKVCYREAKRLANQQFAVITGDERRGG
ncbi:UrcA family protein [Parerythrobacter aurantius]|uniref:UrcA family protein n=1 Tax=Parerythrobacter aurantius TaxID=3127706 RepID=UPI0032509B14